MACGKIPPEESGYKKCECTIYNKLIGKCYCLNQPEFNDFVIQFNDNTRYTTSETGEIIKNIRILKRFMYIMASSYTKNALKFLIDGLSKSKKYEKVNIVEGCYHADICNIFEENSIVSICILWPWRFLNHGDPDIQVQAASLLLKLAELEGGRKYLNLNSKITSDISKITKKRSSHLEPKTVEYLSATMGLLKSNPSKLSLGNLSMKSEDSGSMNHQKMCKGSSTRVKRPKITPSFTT